MKKRILGFMFVIGILTNAGIARGELMPSLVPVNASSVYVPSGFDHNDNVQIVIEGYFPNTCYKSGPSHISFSKNKISIRPQAYYYEGACLQILVHYEQVINLGPLESGNYEVSVGRGKENIASTLNISEAMNAGPDDYLYAPIRSARLISRNKRVVRLEGIFPQSCMSIHQEDIMIHAPENQVVAILPIARHDEEDECQNRPQPFQVDVDLGYLDLQGRFLIHVRSLNGNSFNLIEDFE